MIFLNNLFSFYENYVVGYKARDSTQKAVDFLCPFWGRKERYDGENVKETGFNAKEILAIMHGSFSKEEMLDRIADYHENDIAEAFELLSESERKSWYQMFGPEQIAEIFSYIDDPDSYLKELPLDEAAKVLSFMVPMMRLIF